IVPAPPNLPKERSKSHTGSAHPNDFSEGTVTPLVGYPHFCHELSLQEENLANSHHTDLKMYSLNKLIDSS
ncbi:hypothetical protein, partial [Neobacillus vireti]|uniref:hypothetical protein n=1 Tax=Neobacillus vireti TaxID=220686 RepID=UPI0019556DE0